MAKTGITRRTLDDLTPYERVKALERVKQIADGTLRIPQRCTYCRSITLTEDREYPGEATCGACGKRSTLKDIKQIRRRELQATILDGPEGAR